MFKRYRSIEYSYQEEYIQRCIKQNPEILTTKFVAQEKVDGSNICLILNKDGLVGISGRNETLPLDSNFQGGGITRSVKF